MHDACLAGCMVSVARVPFVFSAFDALNSLVSLHRGFAWRGLGLFFLV